jgi:hypothetical protein
MATGRSSKDTSFLSRIRETGPFLFLLISLLFLVLAGPILDRLAGTQRLSYVLFGVILISATWAVSRNRRILVLALFLVAPAFVSVVVRAWLDLTPTRLINSALMAVFLFFIAIVLLRAVIGAKRVSANEIYGAICVYLLIGIIWIFLYSLVQSLEPGAFSPPPDALAERAAEGALTPGSLQLSQLGYFSFVTLTTLGFGDMAPLTPTARTLAWLEAVTGQLYLTVLVARLVGLHIAHSGRAE